jgi:uncharacterized protein
MTAPWNTDAPLAAYLRRARTAGITRTIVFPAFHSDYAIANRELARLVAHHRSRLTGFAMVHCARDRHRIDDLLNDAVRRYGFRGVKVHGHEHLPTRAVCEAAQRLRIPVLVDVGGKAHAIDMFAPQYPGVDFIIPHLGSFADSFRAHQEVIYQLIRYPNVFADTSGVRRFDYLVEAVRLAGPHKILFGSDGPWLHPGLELHKIKLLGLGPRAQSMITGGNARRLIFGRKENRASPRTGLGRSGGRRRRLGIAAFSPAALTAA